MRQAFVLVAALLLVAGAGFGQEILFDQVVEAGGLKCYPVHGDPTSWYYLPDQPHVAEDASGRPQFSFLMYSSPEERGEEGITSSPGGGVAHLLVAYDVPQEMVRRAQSELQRQKPGAVLKGPVGYTDGTFSLVTAVTDPEAGLLRRVLGVGNAPVMSGHKAAVSMHLTPAGAMLLWESFRQRTPDVSVAFEMTVSGYRNPVEAEMTFDYERIARTIEIEAGIEARYIEADVDVMLGKMVDNGAIKIELKGAPPEQWESVQKLGLELAKNHLFEDLGAAPLEQVREAARGSGTTRRSAVQWPWAETIEMVTLPPPTDEDDRQRADEIRSRGLRFFDVSRYGEALQEYERAYAIDPSDGTVWMMTLCHLLLGQREQGLQRLDEYIELAGVDGSAFDAARRAIEDSPESTFTSGAQADRYRRRELVDDLIDAFESAALLPPSGDGTAADEDRAEPAAAAEEPEAEPAPEEGDGETALVGQGGGEEEGEEEAEPRSPIRTELTRPGAGDADRLDLREAPEEDAGEPELQRISPSTRARPSSGEDAARSGTAGAAREEAEDEQEQVRVTIAFRYRKIERSGTFTFSMRQWNRVELPVRFAANVGDLSRYMDDARMFKRVSLNDPMFKQREIPVTVDVASEEAFAAMLNAVTVTLRKRHQSGRETLDEVTIQRTDFSSGEVETLLYGWDGDDDRERWLDYEQRVRWSYVGGPVIEGGWERTNAGALVLEPPLRPREVRLEADPEVLREQGVRDVVVEVRYPAAGVERTATATVRPEDEVGRQVLVLYQDPQAPGYRYSFDWRMYGGRRVSAGPFEDTADYIYLDEIPR
ncbi:MAG: hypothetical protein C3F15_09865 [Holophagae bacterium]|nr:MAG: hypothetical protein C3F15_09865 [Holophagae bacterium]